MDKALPCKKLVLKAMRESIPHTFLLLDKIKRLNEVCMDLDESDYQEQVCAIEKAVFELKAQVGHTIFQEYLRQFDEEGNVIQEEE